MRVLRMAAGAAAGLGWLDCLSPRTFSSRLNDALFPEALVEASLAHQKKDQVAAAYNHARLAGPRRALMQAWADTLACWMRGETAREVIVRGKVKIDEAAHDAEDMNL